MTHKNVVALFFLVLVLNQLQAQSRYFDISKNLEIFAKAYKEINHSYVDELDPGKLMRQGMDAMLGGLDPFTNYISETDVEGYRIQSDGKYNGVGASGKQIGDYVVITDIYENSPAQKAGLKVGDMLLSIDGQSAKGRTEAQVTSFLRGFPGTEAELVVRRPGETKDLKIKLKREEVIIPNVPHSGMVAKDIAYINLTVFTQDAARNISEAFRDLKNKNPEMKGLILDLRENGGGLLNEAVHIINLFVPKGELAVSMRGKVPEWDQTFKTLETPVDTEIPVVILVNKHSASASEVVSGGLQDMDRAVVMGQRTYGKGLVQNTRELGYNARIKLTTAKYYTPSGRCIQSVRFKNGEPVDIPEAERGQFRTRKGRIVFDGGGIKPDVVLPRDTNSGVVKALLDQNVIFDYVTEWALKNPKPDSIETFNFSDWEGFVRFTAAKKFDYETHSEKKLKELRELVQREGLPLEADLNSMDQKIKNDKKDDLTQKKALIIREIEQEIIGRYFFERGKVRKQLKNDPEVEAAVKLLNTPTEYKKILGQS
jgi:carboxyl-terminal processing protease